MRVKLTYVVTPGGWNLLDDLVQRQGGKRSDYQSAEVVEDDGGSHYLVRFSNGFETYINKAYLEEMS